VLVTLVRRQHRSLDDDAAASVLLRRRDLDAGGLALADAPEHGGRPTAQHGTVTDGEHPGQPAAVTRQ
jgi:hypothetical protein